MILDRSNTAAARTLRLVCAGVVAYLGLVLALEYFARNMTALGSPINFRLTMSFSIGIDFLAAIATVVIALNVGAWWIRNTDTSTAARRGLAHLYARHLQQSSAAELLGLGAIIIGCASFADAAIVGNEPLTGIAVLALAVVISIISLDAQDGLHNSDAIRDGIRRSRRVADLIRLRSITQDETSSSSPPWSDNATRARFPVNRWTAGLWWTYEIVATLILALLGPAVVVAIHCWSDGDFTGYISGLAILTAVGFLAMSVLCGLIVLLAALVVTKPSPTTVVLALLFTVVLLVVLVTPMMGPVFHDRPPRAFALAGAGVWMTMVPVLLALFGLATRAEGRASWIPTQWVRRAMRQLILSTINREQRLLTPATPTSTQPEFRWWRVWTHPRSAASAARRWYAISAGINHSPTPPS